MEQEYYKIENYELSPDESLEILRLRRERIRFAEAFDL